MKKLFLYLVVIAVALWGASIFYNSVISNNYGLNAPLYQKLIFILIAVAGIVGVVKLLKVIKNSALALVLIFGTSLTLLESCKYSKANQIVLYSEDCGSSWKQVPAGNVVPQGVGNPCFVKETMPGYEMQGEMDYYVQFKDKVKVRIKLTYSYLIEDPLLFMKQAKKLGKTNADTDEAQDDNARFEGAENRVIESRVKTITSDEFSKEDVVLHDMNALELTYVDLVNKEMKSRGVRLTVFEMVPDFQPLTAQAIDAANAERIYESKGMKEYGRQITLAKAGANQINVNTKE